MLSSSRRELLAQGLQTLRSASHRFAWRGSRGRAGFRDIDRLLSRQWCHRQHHSWSVAPGRNEHPPADQNGGSTPFSESECTIHAGREKSTKTVDFDKYMPMQYYLLKRSVNYVSVELARQIINWAILDSLARSWATSQHSAEVASSRSIPWGSFALSTRLRVDGSVWTIPRSLAVQGV